MATFPITASIRRKIRNIAVDYRRQWLNTVWGMHIDEGCAISFEAKLDKDHPGGIHIGRDTAVNFGAVVLSYDAPGDRYLDTRIGARCQVGAKVIVLPGVTIGDSCIIAAGSVVSRDIPAGSLVFGNPGRVMETGVVTGKWGVILSRSSKAEPARVAS